jgi:hypothetical protein
LMFFLIFFGFVILFYLLFVSKLWSCSNVLETMEMLFEILLLSFDVRDIRNADAFLGPFVFICLTMFIAIINGHFRAARQQMQQAGNRHSGAFSFMIKAITK